MDAYGGGPGWSWHRPEWDYAGPMATGGTGQGKQPPQAPPAVNDRSTEADRRLADLNNGTGGVNPNGQTGSSMYDDMRNMRAPIGNITLAQDPTGGASVFGGIVAGPDTFAEMNNRGFRSLYHHLRVRMGGLGQEGGSAGGGFTVVFAGTLARKQGTGAGEPANRAVTIDRAGNQTVSTASAPSGTAANRGMGGPRVDDRHFIEQYWSDVWTSVSGSVVSTVRDIAGAAYRDYVKVAGWVQDRIDTAGGYWFGEDSWQGFKGKVKTVWDNPVTQIASMLIPGNWLAAGLKIAFGAFKLFKGLGLGLKAAGLFKGALAGNGLLAGLKLGGIWGLRGAFRALPRGTGLVRHHAWPISWLDDGWRINPNDLPAVLIDVDFHTDIHQKLNAIIGQKNWTKHFPLRSDNATFDQKMEALGDVYSRIRYPEWFDDVADFFKGRDLW